jgi:hypothetical protein
VPRTERVPRQERPPRPRPRPTHPTPPDSAEGRYRVLIATALSGTPPAVRQALQSRSDVAPVVAESAGAARALAEQNRPEVFLVDVPALGSKGIALGVELARIAPRAQVVFLVDDTRAAEVRAARDLGIIRFVELQDVRRWLNEALGPLARLARAERRLDEARRAVESLSFERSRAVEPGLPLAVAERRYREAYLRVTLAGAGGRRMAARLAGVPYTTFCMMLRKLGIGADASDDR